MVAAVIRRMDKIRIDMEDVAVVYVETCVEKGGGRRQPPSSSSRLSSLVYGK